MIKNGVDYNRILFAAMFTPMGMSKHVDYKHEIDWGQRLMLLGPPGTGKTETIYALARQLGAMFYSFKPGAKGEGGVGAVPKPRATRDGKGEVITYPPPDWVEAMNFDSDDRIGIVAVDEFTTADGRMQGAMLGGVQEKEWGSTHLRGRIRVIGMGNEVIDTPGGWDPAPSVANRFCWIPWPVMDALEYGDMLLRDFKPVGDPKPIDARAIEDRVMEQWPAAWVSNASAVRAYLRRIDKVHDQPGDDDPQRHRAWMSQRSLRSLTCALCAADIHGLNGEETAVMARGYVGEGAAREILEHRRTMALVDPYEFLDGKAKFVHDPMRVDVTLTLLYATGAVLSAKVPKPADGDSPARRKELAELEMQRLRRADVWWEFVGQNLKHGLADPVADIAAEVMFKSGLITRKADPVLKAINPIIEKNRRGGVSKLVKGM